MLEPGHPGRIVRLPALAAEQVARYLRVLGVAAAAPTRGALDALVLAQATRVPFENISKLYYRDQHGLVGIPPLDLYLKGIERYHFGGTCYANNSHFCRLLQALGFEAALCGADMSSGADVHAAIIVACDGRELLVDVGYAAPFLRPLPRDADSEVVVSFGNERYVLSPRDHQRRSRLEHFVDGKAIHAYLLKPTARTLEHFDTAVRASFAPGATFMTRVTAVRFAASEAVAVRNLSVIRSSADRCTVERLADREQMVAAIEHELAIPATITRVAIAGLGAFDDERAG